MNKALKAVVLALCLPTLVFCIGLNLPKTTVVSAKKTLPLSTWVVWAGIQPGKTNLAWRTDLQDFRTIGKTRQGHPIWQEYNGHTIATFRPTTWTPPTGYYAITRTPGVIIHRQIELVSLSPTSTQLTLTQTTSIVSPWGRVWRLVTHSTDQTVKTYLINLEKGLSHMVVPQV